MQNSFPQMAQYDRAERLRRYVSSCGYWFASNEEQTVDAKQACLDGYLQPVDLILPAEKRNGNSKNFYVRSQLRSHHELPQNLFRHLINGLSS